MKKSPLSDGFFTELKRQFQTCDLPSKKIKVDPNTVKVLDMDFREIKRPQVLNCSEKRLIVLIAKDQITKKTVVLKQELCGFDSEPRKVIRQALGQLMELGYQMKEAMTMIRFYLDFHNPNDTLPELSLEGHVF